MTNFDRLADAGIDMTQLLQRLMGNESLVRIFIGKFMEDGNYAALQKAFAENDRKQAEYASHTLKGMCGNLSLNRLFALFTEQVRLLREDKYEQAEAMMTEISAAYEHAVTEMKEWLSES